jgi:hypothetical protein
MPGLAGGTELACKFGIEDPLIMLAGRRSFLRRNRPKWFRSREILASGNQSKRSAHLEPSARHRPMRAERAIF